MRSILSVVLVLVFSSVSYGQLGDLRANKYDFNSLSNPYGAGSPYKPDGLMNPYSRYGSPYSNESWTNPYAMNPPRMSNGGELSKNRYRPDSTSNPYGRYGSPYSQDSINNPYGAGNPYQIAPLYVYPSGPR
jgi:hypothetical protein